MAKILQTILRVFCKHFNHHFQPSFSQKKQTISSHLIEFLFTFYRFPTLSLSWKFLYFGSLQGFPNNSLYFLWNSVQFRCIEKLFENSWNVINNSIILKDWITQIFQFYKVSSVWAFLNIFWDSWNFPSLLDFIPDRFSRSLIVKECIFTGLFKHITTTGQNCLLQPENSLINLLY